MKDISLGDLVMILGFVIVAAGVAMIFLPAGVSLLGAVIAFAGQRLG